MWIGSRQSCRTDRFEGIIQAHGLSSVSHKMAHAIWRDLWHYTRIFVMTWRLMSKGNANLRVTWPFECIFAIWHVNEYIYIHPTRHSFNRTTLGLIRSFSSSFSALHISISTLLHILHESEHRLIRHNPRTRHRLIIMMMNSDLYMTSISSTYACLYIYYIYMQIKSYDWAF